MYGFKIYDEENKFNDLKTILNYLNTDENKHIPLEIGSYHKKDYINNYIKENSNLILNINGHCSGKSNIINLSNGRTNFDYIINELSLFKSLNAKYSVIHLANEWISVRKEIENNYIDYVLPQIIELNNIAKDNQFSYYIENTSGSLSLYISLFNKIIELELNNINFCFDIGHALLGNNSSFEQWNIFLDFLVSYNKNLHFHIHTNNGFEDEHLIPYTHYYNQEIYTGYCNNYPEDILNNLNYAGTKIIEANPNIYTGEEIIKKISKLNNF